MERLTFEGKFCDISKCSLVPGGSFCESGSCSQRKTWERLKEYEDTGLTPEDLTATFNEETILRLATWVLDTTPDRLTELVQAERDGRLVVLPEEDYCWRIRGDIAIGLIRANCRRAEQEAEAAAKGADT